MSFFRGLNKRKNYLINRPFQVRLMGWMIGIALAPVSVFFLGHYYFFWQLKKLGFDIQLPPDHVYFRFIETQSSKLFIFFLLCALIALLAVILLGLLLSHQIAGPIHHLKEHLRKLTEGEKLPELRFRKNDFFMEIPELVNKFIDSQKGKKEDK
jgi:MFS family permease